MASRYDPTQDAPPAPPPPAPLRLPRPPQQAVGPKTWACLAGADHEDSHVINGTSQVAELEPVRPS